jgi:hypothetical protein
MPLGIYLQSHQCQFTIRHQQLPLDDYILRVSPGTALHSKAVPLVVGIYIYSGISLEFVVHQQHV